MSACFISDLVLSLCPLPSLISFVVVSSAAFCLLKHALCFGLVLSRYIESHSIKYPPLRPSKSIGGWKTYGSGVPPSNAAHIHPPNLYDRFLWIVGLLILAIVHFLVLCRGLRLDLWAVGCGFFIPFLIRSSYFFLLLFLFLFALSYVCSFVFIAL